MKFLLVDDNEITLEVERLMLESCGLDVSTAMSGEEAVERTSEEQFFMIFMDIHMTGINGFTAAAAIRQTDTAAIIVALSADDIPPTDEDFVRSGMNAALKKPLDMKALKELLERYITIDSFTESHSSGENVIFSYDELLNVMKDEKAVYRLLKQFLTVHKKDCAAIQKCFGEKDFIGAREILHNIIGISGNMFCKRLYDVSCRLIAEARQERCGSLDSFVSVWEHTCEELTVHYERLSETCAVSETSAKWSELREEFFALCHDFDVAAADIFTENSTIFADNLSETAYKKLRRAVQDYDYMWICDNMEVFDV